MDFDDRNKALADVQQLTARLRAVGCPPASKADRISQGVVGLLKELALEHREDGVLLTRIMQVPFTFQAAPMLALKGEAPYEHDGADLLVTIRNASGRPFDLMVGLDWIADQKRGADDVWVDAETGHGRERMKTLEVGEEVEVRAHFAALALAAHSLSAQQPALWESSSALPPRDDLVEVGYRCPGWGDEYTSAHRPARAKRPAGEKAA